MENDDLASAEAETARLANVAESNQAEAEYDRAQQASTPVAVPTGNGDPLRAMLDKLPGHRAAGDGEWAAKCPAHDDRRASLCVGQGRDGRVLVKCQAGCSTADVVRALGLEMSDLFADGKRLTRGAGVERRIVKTYDYQGADGRLLFQVVRFEPKDFRQRRPDGDGWTWKLGDTPRVLYRLPGLLAADPADPVFVVEGEKDADNLATLGLVATTNPGGAGKWGKLSDAGALAGRNVIIIPDLDKPGQAHAKDVAERLRGKAASVKVLALPGDGKDVSDWLASGGTREALLALAAAPEVEPGEPTEPRGRPDDLDWQARQCTDIGSSARLVLRIRADWLWCPAWAAWLRWNGVRWERDDLGRINAEAKAVARGLFDEARDCENEDRQKALGKFALASQKRDRLNAMIEMAKHHLSIRPEALDSDPMALNVLNGTIDLKTGELRPHRQADLCSRLAPVNYNLDAEGPEWNAFLARIFAGAADVAGYVQRIAGLCLTADVSEQAFFVAHGRGANGKSVLLETLQAVLGDYATEGMADLLIQDHPGQHPAEVADLAGRRLVVVSESEEGGKLHVNMVKRLTSGKILKTRFMHGNPFDMVRAFKLILQTNHRPVVRDQSEGAWRRIKLIPFEVVIPEAERDPHYADRLIPEYPGILAWAVQGCLAWQALRGLGEPEAVKMTTAAYREEQNPVADFIEDCCLLSPNAFVTRRDLYATYEGWAKADGRTKPISRQRFNEIIRNTDGIEERTGGGKGKQARRWAGLCLTSADRTLLDPNLQNTHF